MILENNLPRQISVLGKLFDVKITKLKGCYGDCDDSKAQIRIHNNLDLDIALSTLFHEAIHAAFAVSGQNQLIKEEHEEGLVRMLEHAFKDIVDIKKLAPALDKDEI